MRLRGLACLVLMAATTGCLKENQLFDPLGDGSSVGTSGGSTGAPTTGLTQGTGEPECPALAPPSDPRAVCELDALPPFNVATHPVFAGTCDDTPVTVWARRPVDNADLIQVCDADCVTCDDPDTIDLTDPTYEFLKVSNILPPPGECMRVVHAGAVASDAVCRTRRLTLWSGAGSPRFAAGVDSLAPIPGTGITLELGDGFLCECSDADRTETDNDGDLRYPCCVQSPINSHDVILTPDGGCPLRIRRGPANLTNFSTLGSSYDFILHNAYRYEATCAAARSTTYWTMTRAAG